MLLFGIMGLIFGAGAIAFGGLAAYQAFQLHFAPDAAALIVAAGFVSLLALMIIGIQLVNRRGSRHPGPQAQSGDDLELLLQSFLSSRAPVWIQRNPLVAVLISAVAGTAVGYSGNTQGLLKHLLEAGSKAGKKVD